MHQNYWFKYLVPERLGLGVVLLVTKRSPLCTRARAGGFLFRPGFPYLMPGSASPIDICESVSPDMCFISEGFGTSSLEIEVYTRNSSHFFPPPGTVDPCDVALQFIAEIPLDLFQKRARVIFCHGVSLTRFSACTENAHRVPTHGSDVTSKLCL